MNRYFGKKRRVPRVSVEQAEEFFRGNRLNLYGQETFIELYSKRGEDFSNIWFEDLGAELVQRETDTRPVTRVYGRYCVKKTSEDKRRRDETEFECFEGEKVQVIRQGEYRLRYRR
jgi:hypothetical protein